MVQEALHAKGLHVVRAALGSINKRCYAAEHDVDLARLENDRAFKETHRMKMVQYHTERNKHDPQWCLSEVLKAATDVSADVLVLSDLRTRADLAFFEAHDEARNLVSVRITASDEARMERGWVPDMAKDQLHTEIELDGLQGWTACVDNSDHSEMGAKVLETWLQNTLVPRILEQ